MAIINGVTSTGASPPVAQIQNGLIGAPAETADAYGRYMAAVRRGNCYGVFDTGGVTAPAGLSTAPITVTLYNPVNSVVNLVLLYSSALFLVAFAAAAAVWIGINPTGSTATTGTNKATQNMNGGGGTGIVKGLTTATLPSTPTIIGDYGVGLTGAITTVPQAMGMFRFWDGLIQVGPGGALSLQVSTASGANGALAGWVWEEVPVGVTAI